MKNLLIAFSICCLTLSEVFGEVTNCSLTTSWSFDRTYAINQIVRPLSDRKITVNAYLPRIKGSRCSVIYHDMIEPRVFKPVKPKPKSGAQKWLDKIRGN